MALPPGISERDFNAALTDFRAAVGSDWVFTYLKSFYLDETRPLGWNNTLFPNASMPNPLWEMQGERKPVLAWLSPCAPGRDDPEVARSGRRAASVVLLLVPRRRGLLERGHDAEGLQIVVEAAERGERPVERPLAGMAEGRMAEIVGERHRLGQVLLEGERLENAVAPVRLGPSARAGARVAFWEQTLLQLVGL